MQEGPNTNEYAFCRAAVICTYTCSFEHLSLQTIISDTVMLSVFSVCLPISYTTQLLPGYSAVILVFLHQTRNRYFRKHQQVSDTGSRKNTMSHKDTRCYFNVRSKADISQLNLPHGTNDQKLGGGRKKNYKLKTDKLRSIVGKQSVESVVSVLKK